MIRHTVAFRLRHPERSSEEADFLACIGRLRTIRGVKRFEVLKQVGTKNAYTFGLSMEFADSSAYQFYNDHPDHVKFVRDRWVPEVEEFIELDYQILR
jgi:hypothetical protein